MGENVQIFRVLIRCGFGLYVWILKFFGVVLWGASGRVLYLPARPLCLGQGFYICGIRMRIRMLKRLRMCLHLWMLVRAVHCTCMDSLPFLWFYCSHLTTVHGFPVPITLGIYVDQPVHVRSLMWVVAWSILLLSGHMPPVFFRLMSE